MASLLSIINYVKSVVFIILLFSIILANGVYTRDRRKDLSNGSTEEGSDRRSTHSRLQKTENISAEIWTLSSRREPFQRILVSYHLKILILKSLFTFVDPNLNHTRSQADMWIGNHYGAIH